MTIRITLSTPSRLSDERLSAQFRDLLIEFQSRPSMRPELCQILAGALGECKMEMIVADGGADPRLTADEIAAASAIDLTRLMQPIPHTPCEVLA